MAHRAGFVNIIGNPNVGKSTLMNALTGEPLTVITPKAQTTRHRIIGIINGNDYQIVFSDTPGILNPKYKLHKALMKQVFDALGDADVFLYVIEPGEPLPENKDIIKQINVSDIPVILLINKIDNAKDETIALTKQKWDGIFNITVFIPISALKKTNLNLVMDTIISFLPESPPYYAQDELTDKPLRFFVSEIIREKIFLLYSKEIPYCSEVVIEAFKEEKEIIRIVATIFVARESQKAILLGHKGRAIKRLGIEARKDIEAFFKKHIFLDMSVKVSENWRDNEITLKKFGYEL